RPRPRGSLGTASSSAFESALMAGVLAPRRCLRRPDRQIGHLELGASPALPCRDRRHEREVDPSPELDRAISEAKPDRAADGLLVVFDGELEVRAIADPAYLGDPGIASDQERRGILLTERPEPRELLREALVDLGEPDLGVDVAR